MSLLLPLLSSLLRNSKFSKRWLNGPHCAGKPDAATTLLVQECIQLLTLYSDFSEVVRSDGI